MKKQARPTGRDADSRRTIPLQSARWQRLRARILAERPLCAYCARRGIVTIATDVDHISGDPSDNRRENLQSLCHECHSTKTQHERAGTPMPGVDANGWPLDPRHPWNRENRQQPARLDRASPFS